MVEFNEVRLCGVFADEPKLFGETGQPSAVAVKLKVEETFVRRDDTKGSRTDYIPIAFYGAAAEYAGIELGKGSEVLVKGKLQMQRWKTAAGEEKRELVVVVNRLDGVQRLNGLKDDPQDQQAPKQPQLEGHPAGSAEFEEQHGLQRIPF